MPRLWGGGYPLVKSTAHNKALVVERYDEGLVVRG